MSKLLLVEDDPQSAKLVKDWLQHQGYQMEIASDGDEALHYLKSYVYDLVLLDWELPGMSGLEVLKEFRSAGKSTPVLFLTGMTSTAFKESGLDMGADDYLTKPVDLRELSARVRALLRRSQAQTSNELRRGDLTLDRVAGTISKNGTPLNLTPTEFALLEFFITHPNQVVSSDYLLDHVWKSDSAMTGAAVRTTVGRLRKKIDDESSPGKIENVHGFGYRFVHKD
ncbi:MAG: response regulator transcription factor [Candidatus Obscuribacterales bacterium]|nr:response regulator transcription factor [Candidatus Obscuribacterales bacterium]